MGWKLVERNLWITSQVWQGNTKLNIPINRKTKGVIIALEAYEKILATLLISKNASTTAHTRHLILIKISGQKRLNHEVSLTCILQFNFFPCIFENNK